MITWNSLFFCNPGSYSIELLIIINDFIMIFICSIISVISLYILFLFFRFSGFNFCFDSHNELENLWTLIPSFVLLSISFPSLVRLFFVESCIFCGVTLKIIAHQ